MASRFTLFSKQKGLTPFGLPVAKDRIEAVFKESVIVTNDQLNKLLFFISASKRSLRKLKLVLGLKTGLAGLLPLVIGFNLKSLSDRK
jgi:hypothetical protein